MRFWLAAVLVAGCYKPSLQPGSPCDDGHPCPPGLLCSAATSTCETSELDASLVDAEPDGFITDGCTPMPEICGDGIDQDCNTVDPPCPPNDTATGAIDITAGGSFTGDLTFAHDDASKPTGGSGSGFICGGSGGRDIYYKIHLVADETYYLDTFGSDFDSVIRVFHGTCADGIAPNLTKCHNDSCATKQTQGVWDLTTGDTCVVIDQATSAEVKGSVKLRVERGHRTGSPLAGGVQTTVGTTVGGTDQSSSSCTQAGNDVGYYFTACPAETLQVSATTCNAVTNPGFDTALYLRRPNLADVCNDDDPACPTSGISSTISTTASGNHLFYLIVDTSVAGTSGVFELDTNIQ